MDKINIAAILEEIAMLLELRGANPFRIRAYRNAARSLLNSDRSLKDLIAKGALIELEGIGKDLAEKITILAQKKKLPFYEKLKKSIPKGILQLIQIHGLGPKRVKILYQNLKIHTIKELKTACQTGKIARLKGFGSKTERNILDAIEHREQYQKRHLWWNAWIEAKPILEALSQVHGVTKVEIAGSVRRRLETVGDLDFLAASSDPNIAMDWFVSQDFVARVLAKGATRSSIKLKSGMQADLRIIPEHQFGFALCYFTGSKEHNINIRAKSLKKGWSLSEYGFETASHFKRPVFTKKKPTEADIYEALGLAYIPPELRENLGEIEAAATGTLPRLIEDADLRGTFHNHTTASDGKNNLQEMVQAAEQMGWEYIGISDHSQSSIQANGLNEERLLAQIKDIKQLNHSRKFHIHIFAGSECDILPDGKLDYPNVLLENLDFVIASVHSVLNQDEKTMTQRIIRAVEHPNVTILGHLTGRLLLMRESYKVNIEKVIDACIANNTIIEINGNPHRMEMDWRFWRKARDKGLLCCINTDAHSIANHEFFHCGINVARKGWLEKKDVINTRSLKEMQKYLSNT